MKGEKLLSCLFAALLSFCLGLGGVACMVTGLGLSAPWIWLILGCGLGAVLAAVCCSVKRGGWVLLGLWAGWMLLLLWGDSFVPQLQTLLHTTVKYYNRAYGLPVPQWGAEAAEQSQLLPLLVIGGLVMTAAAWTVTHRKRAFLAMGAALLPLISCLVVTDTVPAAWAVFLLLLGLVMLLLTQSVRRQDAGQGNRLTAMLALPVAAGLVLLFCLVPQGDYTSGEHKDPFEPVLNWFAELFSDLSKIPNGEFVLDFNGGHDKTVDLSTMGNRVQHDTPVMEVTWDRSGPLYLRGRDYDRYNGQSWSAIVDREDDFSPAQGTTEAAGTLTIHTFGKVEERYVPYYPAGELAFEGGRLDNAGGETTYSYECATLLPGWRNYWIKNWAREHHYDSQYYLPGSQTDAYYPHDEFSAGADSRYLALPEETRQRAEAILYREFPKDIPVPLTLAQEIENYVKSSASYDLNTGRMPDSETDFAMWFLEQSQTGYCVHFASAATVLLRAAGIPARYVEGYVTTVEAGETATVRNRMAHAWTEYYLEDLGWVILDATPGVDEPLEPTVPETQTQPVQPPTEATRPPVQTEPAAPQSSTEATEPQDTGGTAPAGSGGEQKPPPDWLFPLLWSLALAAAAVMLTVAQWVLRRKRKQERMYSGKPNRQALARYREGLRLARLSGQTMPWELTALAEKARFSQHTLTREELARFDAFLREGVEKLRKKPWYAQFVYRVILALY